VQGIPAEMWLFRSQNSGPSLLSSATVERVCASFQRDLKLLALCRGYVYTVVENGHCTVVWSRTVPDTEQTLYCLVAFIKLVTSWGIGVKWVKQGSFGRNVLRICLSTDADMQL